jgi:hypothetical protein
MGWIKNAIVKILSKKVNKCPKPPTTLAME